MDICVCMYIYMQIANLPVNAIVRLPHPRSGDSHYIYVYIHIYTYLIIHIFTYR